MNIPQDIPVYRILTNFFGPDDHLYVEGDIIQFSGIPNEEMEPLNDLAREAQTDYFEKLEEEAKKAAEKAGRSFIGRPKTVEEAINLAREDSRRTQLTPGGAGVPIMGAKKDAKEVIGKVQLEEIPQTQGKKTTAKGRGTLTLGKGKDASAESLV